MRKVGYNTNCKGLIEDVLNVIRLGRTSLKEQNIECPQKKEYLAIINEDTLFNVIKLGYNE